MIRFRGLLRDGYYLYIAVGSSLLLIAFCVTGSVKGAVVSGMALLLVLCRIRQRWRASGGGG